MHLKHAKELLKPKEGLPLDPDVIKMCLTEMKSGRLGWEGPLKSLYSITYGAPPFYQRMVDKIRQIPPPYEIRTYDDWVLQYGRKAVEIGLWDGYYPSWDNPREREMRLSPQQYVEAIWKPT
jgi:hypothetical protein